MNMMTLIPERTARIQRLSCGCIATPADCQSIVGVVFATG